MGAKLFKIRTIAVFLAVSSAAGAIAQQTPTGSAHPPAQDSAQSTGPGQPRNQWRGRGVGGFPGGGRGLLGSVTEATADHYTIKTEGGESYIVHFSVNTRIMKQPPGQGPGRRQAAASGGADADSSADRPQPVNIKPAEIVVGDVITAGGDMDAATKSIGAVFIFKLDPERARQMREMQANFGKTWLAGRITAIHDTTITIEGLLDHASHSILVDENTSFRKRRDAITLADLQPGEQLRAEGAVKGSTFLATTVTAMQPQGGEDVPGSQPGAPVKPQ